MAKKAARKNKKKVARMKRLNKAFGGVSISQSGVAGATKVQQKKTTRTMKLTTPKKKRRQRQLIKEMCEEDAEFRLEQAALLSRRRGGKPKVEPSDAKKRAFQPAEATFKPSDETLLSHGMTASIQGIGQRQQWYDGGANNSITKNSNNPLLALAQKYRIGGEEGANNIAVEKSNNPFDAFNDNGTDDETEPEPEQKNKSNFSFAPASFTFQSTASPTPAFGGAIIDPDL